MDRPARLNRAVVVAAAREIVEEHGPAAVTLRRVAAALDTGQSTLYRHIADRDELLRLMTEEVVAGYPAADESLPPLARVRDHWLRVHSYLGEHRWAVRVIAEGELTSPRAARFGEAQVDDLVAAGLSPSEALVAYRVLLNLVLGHLLNAHPLDHDRAAAPADSAADLGWAIDRLLRPAR